MARIELTHYGRPEKYNRRNTKNRKKKKSISERETEANRNAFVQRMHANGWTMNAEGVWEKADYFDEIPGDCG